MSKCIAAYKLRKRNDNQQCILNFLLISCTNRPNLNWDKKQTDFVYSYVCVQVTHRIFRAWLQQIYFCKFCKIWYWSLLEAFKVKSDIYWGHLAAFFFEGLSTRPSEGSMYRMNLHFIICEHKIVILNIFHVFWQIPWFFMAYKDNNTCYQRL